MKRVILIIPAADVTRANGDAKSQFDARGGERTFTTGLSPTGKEPPTHFVCSGLLPEDDYSGVKQMLATYPGAQLVDWEDSSDWSKGEQTLAGLGLTIISPPVEPGGKAGAE
jgi:hypothetical protein